MLTELLANNATTTVVTGGADAPASGTSQSWTVASSSPFPAAVTGVSQFHIADQAQPSELIAVTNVSGTTWTVTRGAENTTPVAHASGFTIYGVASAGFFTSPVFAGAVATAGLTGATAASRYAGATASGAPASGTFAVGDFVIDQSGKVWICTVAGTPGTWTAAGPTIPVTIAQGGTGQATQQAALDALAGAVTSGQVLRGNGSHVTLSAIQQVDVAQPWQFLPESYGAKGDGKFLYDASMNGSTAVLTTAGLPAPSSWPAGSQITGSGSGGTISAGVVQVKQTYVNQFGETLPAAAASYTASGSTSSVTSNSPAPWTNATGYNTYATSPGSSTFFKQNATPTPLRASFVITSINTGGAAPPGANTSNSAPFTSGDVGKAIVVPSAGGFLNVPLVTMIATYQSATQVTLAAASTRAVSGAGAVYGTDDTSSIQQAVNAAIAYAQTAGSEGATGEVLFSDKIYCVAGAPGGTYQNAQIQIPFADPYAGPKVHLKLTGAQQSGGPVHWEQPNPPAAGTTIASMYYNDSGSPLSPPQAVIGGPVTGFGGNSGLFSNMRVIVDGLNVLVPYRCSISGLDLFGVGQADVKSFSYYAMARTSTAAGGWPPYIAGSSNPSPWRVWGYRSPTVGNNALNNLGHATVYGPYQGVIFTDHFTADNIQAINCFNALSAEQTTDAHGCFIASVVSELNSAVLFMDNGNSSVRVFIASAQCENANTIVDNANNFLHGVVHAEMEGTGGLISGGKNGAANVRLIWEDQPLGAVASPPAVPSSGTAFMNQFWRDAVVIVSGGTVSAIALDGKTAGATSGPFFVRSGGTITLTYSVVPTWQWILA